MLAGLVEVDESVHTSWNIDGVMVVGLFERHGDMLGHIMSRALASDDTTRHNTNMMTHTYHSLLQIFNVMQKLSLMPML